MTYGYQFEVLFAENAKMVLDFKKVWEKEEKNFNIFFFSTFYSQSKTPLECSGKKYLEFIPDCRRFL